MEKYRLPEKVMVQPVYDCREEWERLMRREDLNCEVLELSTPPALSDGEKRMERLSWYLGEGRALALHGAFMDVNIAGSDPALRMVSAARCEESCVLASRLGVRWVVFHSSAYPYLDSDAYVEKWAAACAEAYLSLAQKYDVAICVENCLDQGPKALQALMDRAAGPELRVCLDLGHLNYSPTPMEEWFDALGGSISYLHLSDNHGRMDEHLPIGAGSVDWEKADRLWRQLGRPTALTLEVGGPAGVEQSLRYLRENKLFGFGCDENDG